MILAPLSRIFLVKFNGFFPESCRLKIKDDKPDTMKLLDYQAFLPWGELFYKIVTSERDIRKAGDYLPSVSAGMFLAPFHHQKNL
jgi:hypothetical protein